MQTVLVIEAITQARDSLIEMLRQEGFAALSAASAESGLDMLRGGGIDAVVLPAGNDEENIGLLTRIKSTFPTIAVVVIASTGWRAGDSDLESGPPVGVVPIPFTRAQIASVLVRVQLASKLRQERLVDRCLH
jgi:DNA-binding NtrC family response regulator